MVQSVTIKCERALPVGFAEVGADVVVRLPHALTIDGRLQSLRKVKIKFEMRI